MAHDQQQTYMAWSCGIYQQQSISQDIFPIHTKTSWKATNRHHTCVHLCDKVRIGICMRSVALWTDQRTIWHTGTPPKTSTQDSLPRFELPGGRVLQMYRLYTKREKPNAMSYLLAWKDQHINCTTSYSNNKINQIYVISENMNLSKQRQRDLENHQSLICYIITRIAIDIMLVWSNMWNSSQLI